MFEHSIEMMLLLNCISIDEKVVGLWRWVERVAKTGATLELVRLVLRL